MMDAHAYLMVACKRAKITPTQARLFLSAIREPCFDMWDSAENASMIGSVAQERALERRRQKKRLSDYDKEVLKDGFAFPTARIWHAVLTWREMIDVLAKCRLRSRALSPTDPAPEAPPKVRTP